MLVEIGKTAARVFIGVPVMAVAYLFLLFEVLKSLACVAVFLLLTYWTILRLKWVLSLVL